MWTRIRLQNFKGYRDTGMLALRPLTILIGPNGGGKSSILQFLMVAQTDSRKNRYRHHVDHQHQ